MNARRADDVESDERRPGRPLSPDRYRPGFVELIVAIEVLIVLQAVLR